MLKGAIEKAINEQIQAELYSAYLYYSMSAYFESVGLPGCASWMRIQALEEMTHAHKFFDFVNERGGRVSLLAIEAPPTEWESPLAAFEAAYKHETVVTGRINALVDLARAEKDHATDNFLQWYVAEQVEEEASADAIVSKLRLVEESRGGLFMVDKELKARTFVVPPGILTGGE